MKKLYSALFRNLDLFIFTILLSTKIIAYGRQIQDNYFSISLIAAPVLASVLMLASISILLKENRRRKALLVLNILLSIVIIGDLNYFRYFRDIPSISVVRNGIMLRDVKSSIGSLFKPTDLLFFADIIIFHPLLILLKERNINVSTNLTYRITYFLIMFALSFTGNMLFIHKLSSDQPQLISTMFNRVYVATELGIVNAHGIDAFNEIKNDLVRHASIPKEKEVAIKNYLETNSNGRNLNLSGAAKGKNLIMIQVEALQEFIINRSIEGSEITPNLNKWIKKSAYFNNFFYQVSSGGTSDAEFMSNNSLYPAPSGAAYYLYSGNEYNSLGNSFKSEGYSTAALHGYKSTFWNRDVMYRSMGFDNFYNERDFKIDSTIGLGLSDKSFLNQSIDKLKSMKKPYYSLLITLSSHFPFDDKSGYGEFNVGKYENTLLGNYLRAIHYTDGAIGSFLDRLEAEGMLEDSIIVLYGDHSAISKDKQQELVDFLGITDMDEFQWSMLQKVPLLIHFPSDKNCGINETFGGEMDIYPTLVNLFSLEADDTLGKDLFNSKDGMVIFRNSSFTDGEIYYSASTNTYYNIADGKKINENASLKAERENAIMQLDYSDAILTHDLLKRYNEGSK